MGILENIRSFMVKEFTKTGFCEKVGDDESLIEAGILDSLSILMLISFMDEKYGVVPSEDELKPENFETINLIAEFIVGRTNTTK